MMMLKYFYIAWPYLKQKRGRSLLTVASLVCGIAIVILLVNFGSGLRRQIADNQVFNQNLITLQSGKTVVYNQAGEITGYNPAQTMGITPSLSLKDLKTFKEHPAIGAATPVAVLNQSVTNLSEDYFTNGHVLATDAQFLTIIDQDLMAGTNVLDSDRATVIIGSQLAKELFNNSRPISHELIIGQKSFIIAGVLEESNQLNPLGLNFDYQRAVLIPFETLQEINRSQEIEATPIYMIMAQTKQPATPALMAELKKQILINHQQKQDFSLFQNNQLLWLINDTFDLATIIIGLIAVVLIIAGGISLMNAMQASVAERATEISLRKAVGATNQQILNQFLLEALILSGLGYLGGVILALVLGLALDYWSVVVPIIDIKFILYMALLVPLIALIFGGKAAIYAALQKPDKHI